MPEIDKELMDELKSTWEAGFQQIHEQVETETKKLGEATGETKQALERANERMDELEVRLQKAAIEAVAGKRDDTPSEAKTAFFDWCRKGVADPEALEKKVLVVANDPAAGFLAPEEFVAEIIKGELLLSPIRQIARVRPTSAVAAKVPKRTGVFAAQWVGEEETRNETTGLSYGMEEIPNHELYAKVVVSNQDIEDSAFDLEAEIFSEASEQFAIAEGTAFVSGNAVKKPEGFLSNSNIQQVHSGNANLVTADGLLNVSANLKEPYAPGASWVMNRKTLYTCRELKDNNNQYLWVPGFSAGLAGGSPATIDGMPYVTAPDMPDVAAGATPIALGNFQRGYFISDRIQMTAQRDPYTAADSGNVVFRFRKRVGGQVVLPEAIKLMLISA